MSDEVVLRDAVLGYPGVSALVADRMFEMQLPQNSFPQDEIRLAIVFQRISTDFLYTQDGETGLRAARYQFKCWGSPFSTPEDVRGLAELVINAMGTFNATQDQTSPYTRTGAPNFLLNEWTSIDAQYQPPLPLIILDLKTWFRKSVVN